MTDGAVPKILAVPEVAPLSPPMARVTYTVFVVPVKLAFTPLALEGVAQGARGLDHRLQGHAVDHCC